MPFDRVLLIETITNQQVYALNWDEYEGWVEVYVNGERTKIDITDLKTIDKHGNHLPVTFPEPAKVLQ